MNGKEEKGMTFMVRIVTKLTLGFILLYGVYIALCGHISPGGGFAGGVIVALAFVHIMLAFGKDVALKSLRAGVLRVLIGTSALVFLYIATAGSEGVCVRLNALLSRWTSCQASVNEIILPLCEMTIVGAGLFAIFVALVFISKAHEHPE